MRRKAAVAPTAPQPTDLERMQAECAALYPDGLGSRCCHVGESTTCAAASSTAESLGEIAKPASWPPAQYLPEPRRLHKQSPGLRGAFVRSRETAESRAELRPAYSAEFENRFYTDDKQRGPGTKHHPAGQIEETAFLARFAELYKEVHGANLAQDRKIQQATPVFSAGRLKGPAANKKKSDELKAQIAKLFQSLPIRIRTGTEIAKRMQTKGVTITGRAVNRHLRALGL